MKKQSTFAIIYLLLIIALVNLYGCKKKGKCDEVNISKTGNTESHNFGQNCMSCHQSGGEGEGCFSAAGSVSNSTLSSPLSSGTIKFFTEANGGGLLKHTIEIDAKGNFHTTESIDFKGLYPTVTGSNGVAHHMSSSLNSGACNSCHGSSTSKLWAN